MSFLDTVNFINILRVRHTLSCHAPDLIYPPWIIFSIFYFTIDGFVVIFSIFFVSQWIVPSVFLDFSFLVELDVFMFTNL